MVIACAYAQMLLFSDMRVRKSGPGAITDQQQKLIGQTLKFANMRKLVSTHQVESLFSTLDFFGYPDPTNSGQWLYDSLNPNGDSQKEVEGVEAFERDRDKLREILTMIIEKETLTAIHEVNAGLVAVTLRIALSPSGEVRIAGLVGGVQAAIYYALASILSVPAITRRLSRCGAPNCSKFILDFVPKWRKHCNEAHRRAADKLKSPARSKEWREIRRPAKRFRLRVRLEERMKKIVKWITQIPARLDGTEVDPIGRIAMDWEERDYDLVYNIRKQIRAGDGWRKVLDNLSNAERRRLRRMQFESDDSS
jgi:hypothetical protein